MFRGAGWNVIKVIWGSKWDELLAQDKDGVLLNKMNTTVDGEFQRYAVETGDYIRDNFFGPDPRLRQMVANLSDDELRNLPRGGHDYRKLYAAYKAATENLGTGAPTVILCKTIKGWTLGAGFEGRNATHQIKKMTKDQLVALRDRLYLQDEIPDDAIEATTRRTTSRRRTPIEYQYMMERRKALGGSLPKRTTQRPPPAASSPTDKPFAELRGGSGKQAVSTTMGFTRLLRNLARDEHIGPRVVPIIPDEARTFGMDALFRELKIYASQGQKYEPVDHDLLLTYTESTNGPDPRGGHHRGRVDGELHRRRHELRPPRRADGALLHLLFDVRVPARRRPHLAGRRRPGPRVPARRHRRAHDAARRGAAAPGRPQPACSPPPCRPCQAYDPAFAYEVGRHRPGRHAPHVRRRTARRRARRLLLPHALQRELRDAADARGRSAARRGRHRRGPVQVAADAPDDAGAPGDDPVLRHAPRARRARPPPSWPSTTTSAPSCGRRRSTSALREDALAAERWNRLHPDQPSRARRASPSCSPTSHGPDRRRDRLHGDRARAGRPVPARPHVRPARHRRHGPLRHPRGAAPALRDRHRPRRASPCSAALARRRQASSAATSSTDAIARYGIDPDAVDPMFA